MSILYDEVKAIVDNFDKVGTATELDHALLEILYFCDSSDYFGDSIETGDIRSIVEKRIGETVNEA